MKPKNCPCCNSPKIKIYSRLDVLGPKSQACCLKCGVRGPVFAQYSEAVRAWNQIAQGLKEENNGG